MWSALSKISKSSTPRSRRRYAAPRPVGPPPRIAMRATRTFLAGADQAAHRVGAPDLGAEIEEIAQDPRERPEHLPRPVDALPRLAGEVADHDLRDLPSAIRQRANISSPTKLIRWRIS